MDDEIFQWEPGLYIRGGNLELKDLENEYFGTFGADFFPSFPKTEDGAKSEQKLPISAGERSHWMNTSDLNQNIRELTTNAGWYPSKEFDLDELRIWAILYFGAYMKANGVFRYSGIDMY